MPIPLIIGAALLAAKYAPDIIAAGQAIGGFISPAAAAIKQALPPSPTPKDITTIASDLGVDETELDADEYDDLLYGGA